MTNNHEKGAEMSRRKFVKGAAALFGSLLAGGVLASCENKDGNEIDQSLENTTGDTPSPNEIAETSTDTSKKSGESHTVNHLNYDEVWSGDINLLPDPFVSDNARFEYFENTGMYQSKEVYTENGKVVYGHGTAITVDLNYGTPDPYARIAEEGRSSAASWNVPEEVAIAGQGRFSTEACLGMYSQIILQSTVVPEAGFKLGSVVTSITLFPRNYQDWDKGDVYKVPYRVISIISAETSETPTMKEEDITKFIASEKFVPKK